MSSPVDEIPELPAAEAPVRDGIGEEDNLVPAWFNWSWIGTWIFGVLYIAWYLGFSDWSSASQYLAQVEVSDALRARAEAEMPSSNPYRGDEAAIAAGAQVWGTICVACHLPTGEGLVGPSLIDPYWKYGHEDADLFETVSKGRPGGMPPWGAQLGSERIWQVLAYIETLPRTDEPGVGAPGYTPPGP